VVGLGTPLTCCQHFSAGISGMRKTYHTNFEVLASTWSVNQVLHPILLDTARNIPPTYSISTVSYSLNHERLVLAFCLCRCSRLLEVSERTYAGADKTLTEEDSVRSTSASRISEKAGTRFRDLLDLVSLLNANYAWAFVDQCLSLGTPSRSRVSLFTAGPPDTGNYETRHLTGGALVKRPKTASPCFRRPGGRLQFEGGGTWHEDSPLESAERRGTVRGSIKV